jgi:hypothetical protein
MSKLLFHNKNLYYKYGIYKRSLIDIIIIYVNIRRRAKDPKNPQKQASAADT